MIAASLLAYLLLIPLVLAALLALLVYGGLPLMVKSQQHQRAHSALRPTPLESLPPDVHEHLARMTESMHALGFGVTAVARADDDVPGVAISLVIFTRPSAPDTGYATFVEADAGEAGRRVTTTLGFENEYTDRTSIETTNFRDGGVHPPDPNKRLLSIPGLTDVALLYEVHRRRVARLAPATATPKRVPPGQEIAALLEQHTADLRRVAAAGYYRLDEPAQLYRPTLKGAYLMTWKLLPPFQSIRRAAKLRRARRELRDLGLEPARIETLLNAADFQPAPA